MWQRQVTRRRFLGCTAVAAGGIWLPAAASSRLAPAALGGQASPFRAGAAVADITPPVGASLKGPIAGNGVVKAIHDPLRARCLALDDGRVRLAICVCDATMIWQRSMDRAKRLVEERTGLPAGSILISASHSHAAPRIIGMVDSPIGNRYHDYAERQIAEAICAAVGNLAPANIGWGVGALPQFVALRRFRIEPGSNGPNPFGEVTDRAWMYARPKTRIRAEGRPDPQVSVVSVRHADDRPLAVLANYSIHYTGGFERNTVSGDFYPCFAERLAALLGAEGIDPPFVGIMSNGNSGNIGPASGGYQGMRKVGDALAREVLRVCEKIEHRDRVSLAMREEELELGVRRPDEERMRWARDVLAGKWDKPAHAWRDVYARNALELAKFPPTVSPKFQAIRIGDLGIASNPNEMFAETGLEIKEQSPLQAAFNIQLANGYNGYLPTPEQHALGGYTTWPAVSSYLEIDASSKIRDHLLRLLGKASEA
ncbi:MAG: hypothetical protein ACOX1P_11555 [Thermoguttaceae bacterium]|jgi:neutral ceramidase